jgi:carnosine N-methyltransferase
MPPKHSADGLKAGYSCVITLFFIDTSPNVLSTLQQIYRLLRPGGIWINLGPLLWPVEAKLEPCLEEVWAMCRNAGFEPAVGEDGEEDTSEYRSRRVPCEYTRDKGAMMRWVYEAEFWAMKKPL